MAGTSKAKAKIEEEVITAESVEEIPAPVESVYTASELAASHKAFNTSREIVVVALRLAGKESATFAEAQSIIDRFRNKEVK